MLKVVDIILNEGGSFDAGTEVTIIATPNPGYDFAGWSDETCANEKIVTMNSNITINQKILNLLDNIMTILELILKQFQRTNK